MGTVPVNVVTNKYGQSWDTPNVYVNGACLLLRNPGMNPTGTVLAYLASERMVNRYINAPEEVMTA